MRAVLDTLKAYAICVANPESTRLPLHITQAFGLEHLETDLDFFDANLQYDSELFLDPFLLKRSPVSEEQALFTRFSDFFRKAYDESVNILTSQREYDELLEFLDFNEPKEICLGYTEYSNSGSSPGKGFGAILIKFFLETTARQLIKEDVLYPDKKFNPTVFEIFTRKLGPDGLSDITANLIMDCLIAYTQEQCKKLDIPTKNLAVDADGFDFNPDEMQWRGGSHYALPENPFYPGRAVIFVPKRLLRSAEYNDFHLKKKVVGILSTDPALKKKFTKMLEKNLDSFNDNDAREILLKDYDVFRRFMVALDEEERLPYDSAKDPLAFMAYRKYKDVFAGLKPDKNVTSHKKVLEVTVTFVNEFSKHMSKTDAWRDMWTGKGEKLRGPNTEKVFQRIVFAMGKMFFFHYPELTFEQEVGTGNGPVDFKVIYKDCRIAIELKRLLSGAYMDGLRKQLPEYAELADTTYALYITAQHYTRAHPRGDGKNHDEGRVTQLEAAVPEIEKAIKKNHKKFKKLLYFNIDVSPKPSASKKS